jgi:hypothetical protein
MNAPNAYQLKHKMKWFSEYIMRLCITNNNKFTIQHFSFWPISQIIGNKIYIRASPSVNVITWCQQLSSIFKHGQSTQWTTENTGHHRLYYCCFGVTQRTPFWERLVKLFFLVQTYSQVPGFLNLQGILKG